jgi:TOBE domain-containing protein
VRPHDIRLKAANGDHTEVKATVERIVTLSWFSRVILRLPSDEVLTAELPNEELEGIELGSMVSVDLRRAKAFRSGEAERSPVGAEEVPSSP